MKKAIREERHWGKRVALKRYSLGLTQLQLAKRIGVSRETIANIERGHQRSMLETALKLRKTIGVFL